MTKQTQKLLHCKTKPAIRVTWSNTDHTINIALGEHDLAPKGKLAQQKVTLDSLDEPTLQAYEALRTQLNGAKTVSALFKLVNADFKAEVARLPEVAQVALRDTYAIARDELRGKVEIADIVDVALTIAEPPNFLEPKEFKNDDGSKKMTQSVVVTGIRDDSNEKFEFITSAVRIVRHFEKATVYPQHITIYAESAEQQHARGATAGQKPMWLVRRMPAPAEARSAVPF